jgi:hypothetical protein
MGLPEKLPLRTSDLNVVTIQTPFIADHCGNFGAISTEHFIYSAYSGNKLCAIGENSDISDEWNYYYTLKERYLAPLSQFDSNAPYKLATQWLAGASVDIKALEHDYKVLITARVLGQTFVPLYKVQWVKGLEVPDIYDCAATVELVEPERSLKFLSVEKTDYIKREPLVVPNREKLLSQTNAPAMTNAPIKQ